MERRGYSQRLLGEGGKSRPVALTDTDRSYWFANIHRQTCNGDHAPGRVGGGVLGDRKGPTPGNRAARKGHRTALRPYLNLFRPLI